MVLNTDLPKWVLSLYNEIEDNGVPCPNGGEYSIS